MAQSFRRNLSFELVDYIPAPTQGWNPDSIPWELPEAQAPVLDNFLIRPGNIMARGSLTALANTNSTAPSPVAGVPAGAMLVSNLALNGYMPWDAPVIGGSGGGMPHADTDITWVDATGSQTTSTVAARHIVPGPRWINLDGELYGLGFDSEATPLHDKFSSYFIPATQLLTQGFVANSGGSGTQSSLGDNAATGTNWIVSGIPANLLWKYNATTAAHTTTSVLTLTDWEFNIPASTTIVDLALKLGVQPTTLDQEYIVQLVHSGATIGSAVTRIAPANTFPVDTYQLSDFAVSLTQAEINDSTFGIQIQFRNQSPTATAPALMFAFSNEPAFSITYKGTINTTSPVAHPNAPQGAVDLIGYLSALWLLGGCNTPGTKTTTTSALVSGTSYTTIAVNALPIAYPASSTIWISNGTTCQSFNLTTAAGVGATSLVVTSQAANAAYPIGSTVVSPSATPHSSTTLYFTTPPTVAGGGDDADDWKDVHSGLVNEITIDQDSSDPGIGLAVSRTGLIVFRRNSVWLMRGTSPANFSMVQISDEVGCLDPRSIVQTDNGVYFMSLKGLMLTDGSKVQNISGTVTYTLQQAISAQQWAMLTGNGGYITSGLTSQGQILISIGQRTLAGNLVPIWSAMYDQTLAAWTRITSNLWNSDSGANNGNVYPGLIISDKVTALRSIHSLGTTYVTLFEDQTLQYSFLNQSGLYDYDTAGGTHAIPLLWLTRFFPIIGTASYQRKWGQAKRFMLDHTLSTANPTSGTPGWSVSPANALGANPSPNDNYTMLSTISTTSAQTSVVGQLTSAAAIQRENLDFVPEVDDVSLVVQFLDPTNTGTNDAQSVIANIYGVGIEYQGYGHDKRGS